MIDTVLFDLDGTLLPMDQDQFLELYMKALAKTFAPGGYDPKLLVSSVWKGTGAMVKNDGSMSNRERFWQVFSQAMGEDMLEKETVFEDFYRNQFAEAKAATGFQPLSGKVVRLLRSKGYTVALATNPLFPQVATLRRMGWAGLSPEDFDLVTTYEADTYCKPNLDYYRSVLERLGKEPGQCMMVGNDVDEDMGALDLGMQVFLLTDCLINRREADVSLYPNGGFPELQEHIRRLV